MTMIEIEEVRPDLTVTFDEWVNVIREKNDSIDQMPLMYRGDLRPTPNRVDAMRYLSKCKSIHGYMTEPVSIFSNKTIEAPSKYASSLDELKEYLDSETNKVFLYGIYYIPSAVILEEYDEVSGKMKAVLDADGNETYKTIPSQWRLRFAIVESD
jgi:hypothetical protein